MRAVGRFVLATGAGLSDERVAAIIDVLQHRGFSDVWIIWAAEELAGTMNLEFAKSVTASDFTKVIENKMAEIRKYESRNYVN